MITFDDILTKRIKFGKSQIITLISLGMACFFDGAEYIFTNLTNPVL